MSSSLKVLSHNQQIRIASFRFAKKIEVITLRGLHTVEKYSPHMTWEEYEARERKNCALSYIPFKPAWTLQAPSVLTANYPGKETEFAKRAAEYAAAVEIANGEHVIIEGVEFKVKVNGEQYQDPVAFIPVDAA